MLELRSIRKAYTTASLVQIALDDVSVSFRDNEFVAILGQSGSGKTTMLNIIGGLDQFDAGDLVIDGISTRDYKDRDWDTYRNNRIGFVFQAYNLIAHQSVLSNVELALTLSGVSRSERRERARQALIDVGLADHIHKKPNQLSGGQMQRVAIARALVNDPEILLADEPTGALDSATSVQVMDLLKEVAKDRLVIMVTHNPELAHHYATRIVELADGRVIADSDPFDPAAHEQRSAKDIRRASMSFFTALALSFSNLMTKKGRTLMTAFAGSIGIIGIAAILALANGVNEYIADREEELLTTYPLSIEKVGFDFGVFFEQRSSHIADDGQQSEGDADAGQSAKTVRTDSRFDDTLDQVTSNDLRSLRTFLLQDGGNISSHVQSIDYTYKVTPHLFLPMDAKYVKDEPVQAHPSTLLEQGGVQEALPEFFAANAQTDTFRQLPSSPGIYEESIGLLKGHWPRSKEEMILVLPASGELVDVLEYNMGLRDRSEITKSLDRHNLRGRRSGASTADKAQSADTGGADAPTSASAQSGREERVYSYDEFLKVTYKLVNAGDRYTWDDSLKVWADQSKNKEHMTRLVNAGETLRIVGVAKALEADDAPALVPGIYYAPELTEHLIRMSEKSGIVKDQLARPNINVVTGKSFDEEGKEDPLKSFDMSKLLSIDEAKIQEAFGGGADALASRLSGLDMSGLDLSGLDLSGMDLSGLDMGNLDLSSLDMSQIDLSNIGAAVDPSAIDFSALTAQFPELAKVDLVKIAQAAFADGVIAPDAGQRLTPLLNSLAQDFLLYLQQHAGEGKSVTDLAIEFFSQESVSTRVREALTDPQIINQEKLLANLTKALGEDPALQHVGQAMMETIVSTVGEQLAKAFMNTISQAIGTQIQQAMAQTMTTLMTHIQEQIVSQLQNAAASFHASMADAFTIDEKKLAEAFVFKANAEELSTIFTSILTSSRDTYDTNLKKFGYGDLTDPDTINIYPLSFEDKESVKTILEDYNASMRDQGQDKKVITYTDFVGALMSGVTEIVNMISTMLIAFVAISLVVSSIMIGIITYISVLERKKEIGILRSIGASRGDIRRVFNAETILVGLLAGMIGIGVTLLLTIPANAIVESQFGVSGIAQLPPGASLVLIGISVVLTLIAGIIPAGKAAKADPVEALRSE
ncbi:ATP-binding cassette domain-containing protein [Schaalia sp. Marseille-Q2122]|uniref:ATP-binding cassette domain-containing protein n=1 Tax=Schaalia sp. Marseille-Q2122 TaxID=2736604 RepID=UPI0015885131|nr:ATP-binding cassette domain-containing protein [Schaalia sp. Marseille-Q2122]